MRLARRSCVPVDRKVDVTRFECWWPAAGGNPASSGRVSRELAKRPAPRAPRKWCPRAVPEGRKCPAVTRRTCSVAPRHAGGVPHSSTRVRLSGGGFRRFGYERSGGSRPQRWGTATDEEETFGGWSAGGDADLVRVVFGRQRRAPQKPSEPHVRHRAAIGSEPICGENRRSGGRPQGRNENHGHHAVVRSRARARVEWTQVGIPEEGHPTTSREEDSPCQRITWQQVARKQVGSARFPARRR